MSYQKIIMKTHVKDFFPYCFSSRSFIISSVTLKLLIHFKLIFVTGLRGLLSFFYTWISNFHSTIYGRDFIFSIKYSWLLVNTVDHISLNLFLGSQFYFIGQFVYFYASIIHFDDYSLTVWLETSKCDTFCFVLIS